jgi:hypothetical protein
MPNPDVAAGFPAGSGPYIKSRAMGGREAISGIHKRKLETREVIIAKTTMGRG